MAAELRWILLVLCVPLLAGIWWWSVRRSKHAPGNSALREPTLSRHTDVTPPATPGEPQFDPDAPIDAEPPRPARAAASAGRAGERGARIAALEPLEIHEVDPMSMHADSGDVPVLDAPLLAHPEPAAAPPPPPPAPPRAAPSARPAAAHSPGTALPRAAASPVSPVSPGPPGAPVSRAATIAPAAAPASRAAPPSAPPPGAPPPGAPPHGTSPPRPPSRVVTQPVAPPPRPAAAPTPSIAAQAALVPRGAPASKAAPAPTAAPAPKSEPPRSPSPADLQKIVTLRVSALGDARWSGAQLLAALDMHGLAYGKYQVFHRRHSDGQSLYCVASLVEPGTFDFVAMESQEFRGITLFAVLPGPIDANAALDDMLATANGLAHELSGSMQDSKGMPLTPQRAAALRDDVAHFQAALSGA